MKDGTIIGLSVGGAATIIVLGLVGYYWNDLKPTPPPANPLASTPIPIAEIQRPLFKLSDVKEMILVDALPINARLGGMFDEAGAEMQRKYLDEKIGSNRVDEVVAIESVNADRDFEQSDKYFVNVNTKSIIFQFGESKIFASYWMRFDSLSRQSAESYRKQFQPGTMLKLKGRVSFVSVDPNGDGADIRIRLDGLTFVPAD